MELLVVITIIGILIALLLPAVQAAREAARKMQCSSNIKQLGLGVLNYESQFGIFPPSSIWAPGVTLPADQGILAGHLNNLRANWVILISPFIELQSIHDSFDLNSAVSGSTCTVNMTTRSIDLPVMLCPSDSYNSVHFMGSHGSATGGLGDNWARGNYAANAALGRMASNSDPDNSPILFAALPSSIGWSGRKSKATRGIMGANCAVTMAEITDGASNTLMLAEIRAGVTDYDSRGVWAMAGGSSALWRHGCLGGGADDYGPNCHALSGDDGPGCPTGSSTTATDLILEGMSCLQRAINYQQTARSMHPGGVNTCFADGSVHWISDYIQVCPSLSDPAAPLGTYNTMSVWDRLNASSDEQIVDSNSF